MAAQLAKQSFWQHHVQSWQASGLSQAAYCKHHQLKLATFGYWRSKLSREVQPAEEALPALTLVPVSQSSGRQQRLVVSDVLVMHSPGGWRLDIPATLPLPILSQLLRALP
jgi:hypothetical protein